MAKNKKLPPTRSSSSSSRVQLFRVGSMCAVVAIVARQCVRLFTSPTTGPPRVVLQSELVNGKKEWQCWCSVPRRKCRRVVIDSWVSESEMSGLLSIYRGVSASAEFGGPTIFDLNSGYVMSPGGELSNVYAGNSNPFGPRDFELYRTIIRRLKKQVEDAFGEVYFTAPTFLARLSGENRSWMPSTPHDEYWHPHVDKENTQHYDYSGLLYLSDYDLDFEGGQFEFLDDDDDAVTAQIQPRKGRLLLFESVDRHCVRRVTSGQRFALSFWFTLDSAFEFADYLDGQMHLRYSSSQQG